LAREKKRGTGFWGGGTLKTVLPARSVVVVQGVWVCGSKSLRWVKV